MHDAMFYAGDLPSGIAHALQEHRLVGCFVHNDGGTSQEWERAWLPDDEVRAAVSERMVLLRLREGSQETEFLSAFCAIPSVPCLLVIDKGHVSAQLTADLDFVAFRAALHRALASSPPGGSHPMTVMPSPAAANTPNLPSHEIQNDQQQQQQQQQGEAETAAAAETRPASRRAKAASGTSSSGSSAEQARKAKKAAQTERQRILQQIEYDKKERHIRAREQHLRTLSQSEADAEAAAAIRRADTSSSSRSVPSGALKECALQVRLFDGSTIRQRFSAWKTLRTHVRPWVDKHRGAAAAAGSSADDRPYTFRHLLTPRPNRGFEVGEEDEALEALGLCPSATLVLVPVSGYTNAYATPMGSGGYLAAGVVAGVSRVAEGVGALGRGLGALLGYGGTANEAADSGPAQPSVEGDEARGRQPLYTGNGINVEPRVELKREESWG